MRLAEALARLAFGAPLLVSVEEKGWQNHVLSE